MPNLYNEDYYRNCCGLDYGNKKHWEDFFNMIASRIVEDFNPKIVLDAGCSWGYLVAALRDKGVESYGIDISEYAISQARSDIQPYCVVGSLTNPLPSTLPNYFDLVINIEVLEHLYEEDSLKALQNMCQYTDRILFSSTPSDITEATHYNVQQPEYWAKNFAKHNFFRLPNYNALYISPNAICFEKGESIQRVVENYERQHRLINYNMMKMTDSYKELKARVYYSQTDQFSEDQRYNFSFQYNSYYTSISFQCEIDPNINFIRIDPIEDCYCFIKDLIVELDEISISPALSNQAVHADHRNLDCFSTKDPWYVFDVTASKGSHLAVSFDILVHPSPSFTWELLKYQQFHKKTVQELEQNVLDLKDEIDTMTSLYHELKTTLNAANVTNHELETTLNAANVTNHELQTTLNAQYETCETLRLTLEQKYTELEEANKSNDELTASMNIYILDIQNLCNEKKLLEDELQAKTSFIHMRNAEVEGIYKSTSWRITKPVRFVVCCIRGGLRTLKNGLHLMNLGLISIKNRGIKTTWYIIKERRRRKKQIAKETPMETKIHYIPYSSEYQDNELFNNLETDIKTITFYLPQFHQIPENDQWWGKGFVEWHNTKKARMRFEGHYQPRTPHQDIGYYDLSDVETLKKQAKMAKEHGIYGFCFYYYWFSGKRLLEKPIDLLIAHPEIDIHFCLCWANENWTRAWDGKKNNIMMKQNYSVDDEKQFIIDMQKYLNDPRYIRVYNKPVIIVYNPGEIPRIKQTFATWRKVALDLGIGDILIWTCQTCNNDGKSLKILDYIDGEVQFPPHNMWHESLGIRDIEIDGKEAFIYNYQQLVDYIQDKPVQYQDEPIPVYPGSMLGWDNAARREDGWTTFYAFSLQKYYEWLRFNIGYVRRNYREEERFVFINAWNEWGEGTYLEPDEKYGYASINTTTKALLGYPLQGVAKALMKSAHLLPFVDNQKKPRIAVHIHLFYIECIELIISQLNAIPYRFDCYISTDTADKKIAIQRQMVNINNVEQLHIEIFPNRGRDVAPFINQLKNYYNQYEFLCHIHSKKTRGSDYGELWRDYLYKNLLDDTEYVQQVLNCFLLDSKLGILFPETYPPLINQAEWGGNKDLCSDFLSQIGIHDTLPEEPVFPVGNMFWARSSAIKTIFDHCPGFESFPTEKGQVNATLAHAIERSWCYIAKHNGYHYLKTCNFCDPKPSMDDKKRIAFFVHYDKDDIISDSDKNYVISLHNYADEVIFISNSAIEKKEYEKIDPYITKLILRDNKGFDFYAWREGLLDLGFDYLTQYDEIVLANNSCYTPIYDLDILGEKMKPYSYDFWGITLFPYTQDGTYLSKSEIPEHIQSYFMVFNNDVISSSSFQNFWINMTVPETLIDAVANCESVLTDILKKAGFQYGTLIKESSFLSKYVQSYAIPYEMPYLLLILRSPFIKKKCMDYMNDGEKGKLLQFLDNFKATIRS